MDWWLGVVVGLWVGGTGGVGRIRASESLRRNANPPRRDMSTICTSKPWSGRIRSMNLVSDACCRTFHVSTARAPSVCARVAASVFASIVCVARIVASDSSFRPYLLARSRCYGGTIMRCEFSDGVT